MKLVKLLLLACLAAATAFAAQTDPAGDKLMHDYVLTMPKIKAFGVALEALDVASKKDSALAEEVQKSGDEPDQTVDQLRAKFDHHPKIFAFFAKEDLSKDDSILIPLTLINAASVAQYPQLQEKMKAVVSPEQIAFCKVHLEELKKMKFFNGGDQ
jgi:hypothetical protein